MELLIRAHRGHIGNPVRLMAPTGMAAKNIGGSTMHSLLKLPIEDVRTGRRGRKLQYTKLKDQAAAEAREQMFGVRYIVIDEISMVSSTTLQHTDARLREITASMSQGHGLGAAGSFGNISMIFVGDFFQLPPVQAGPLFVDGRPPHAPAGQPAVGGLWHPQWIVLRQNMRQVRMGSGNGQCITGGQGLSNMPRCPSLQIHA